MIRTNTRPLVAAASLVAWFCALPLAAASYELLPAKDARILGLAGYEAANFRQDILSVYTNGDNTQRTLLQFDLSEIVLAPGERLGSATLRLYASTAFGG